MESNAKTPKYIDRAGDDQNLKEELSRAIDREMEKSPENIDYAKIDSMIRLLEQMNDQEESVNAMDREEFARKYLGGYVNLSKPPSAGRMRAAVVLAVALLLGAGNYISVRATSKDIFTNLKEKVYIVYFDVLKHSAGEHADYDKTEDFQEIVDMKESVYASWDEVWEVTDRELRSPQYIPDGMELQKIHLQQSGESDLGISAQYFDGTYSLRLLIRAISEDGKWLSATEGLENPPDKKEIIHLQISFFSIDDGICAMFQDGDYMYIIETNMEQEILEKVISEMR